jgi:two-component system, LuxR family, response regulator FixJ
MTSRPRILLVDDDPSVREALAFSLGLEGFDVAAFASADELVGDARVAEADCLILDYRLVREDGLQALERLRGQGVKAPAIIMASTPPKAVRALAARAGATLVEKPLLCDGLTAAIRTLTQRQKAA